MTKEKLLNLTKYLGRLEERASAPVTNKWSKSPKTYKVFIQREIDTVKKQLADAALEGVKK